MPATHTKEREKEKLVHRTKTAEDAENRCPNTSAAMVVGPFQGCVRECVWVGNELSKRYRVQGKGLAGDVLPSREESDRQERRCARLRYTRGGLN